MAYIPRMENGSNTVSLDEAMQIALEHHQAGRLPEAEAIYREVLQVDENHAAALCLFGVLAMQTGNVEAAYSLLERGLKFDPNNVESHNNFGVVLKAKNRRHEAVERFRIAISIAPSFAHAHNNLGQTLHELGELDAALSSLEMAISLSPNSAEAHCNLGLVFQDKGDFCRAIDCYKRAISCNPDFADPYCQLGVNLVRQGSVEESISFYDKALELKPDFAVAKYNRGSAYLSLGQYREGWVGHQVRFDPSLKLNCVAAPDFDFPQWEGQALVGRSIVILEEQGIGDDIQFCRYASVLKALGATRVSLVCINRLHKLLGRIRGIDAVVARSDATKIIPHDFWVHLHSIPLHCGTALETIPADIPYLSTDTALTERVAGELGRFTDLKIGICWKGSAAYKGDAERSPGLGFFKPIFGIDGVRIFTLLPNSRVELLASAGEKAADIGHEVDEFTAPFEETAALIMNLDLVVTSDTSICHLAGALGKPVWLVLPYSAHWVWMTNREDSPWYPNTRLFRQTERGNWAEVFERVTRKMRAVLAGETPLVWPTR